MANLTDLPETRLAILDALPDGLLDCGARDLHRILRGPTLFELPGRAEPPLFVSVLLHGNEDSGLAAVQNVLRSYLEEPLPRSMMLLIGNVDAARLGLRRLEGQPDYNRIWPGAPSNRHSAETRIMAEVTARALDRRAFAAIDIHNNTGRNPLYAIVCDLDRSTLGLASLFARRVVRFRGIPGTSTAAFAGRIPAVTVECGLPGCASNEAAAARFLAEVLNLDQLPEAPADHSPIDLYHTIGVVRLKEGVSFLFSTGEADVCFDPAIDEQNFRDTPAGTIWGATVHPMPLSMIDEFDHDLAEQYFEVRGSKLRLRKNAVPAMLTTDPTIVRQDCLCYLMERL